VAGLCLLAQLMGLIHLALVQHATCIEHDALVHAEQKQAAKPGVEQAAEQRVDATERARTRSLQAEAPDSASHADHHCLAAGFRRPDLASLRSEWSLAVAPAGAADGPAHREGLPPPAPVALLHLAPKSSPPLPPV
jgi:hypothetical protein